MLATASQFASVVGLTALEEDGSSGNNGDGQMRFRRLIVPGATIGISKLPKDVVAGLNNLAGIHY
jgi:hypothetical protein